MAVANAGVQLSTTLMLFAAISGLVVVAAFVALAVRKRRSRGYERLDNTLDRDELEF